MSIGDITTTVIGNLTDNPELRFTPSGAAVVAFTIASSSRVYDKTAGEWKDGATVFMRCSAWRHLAEHAGDSLEKGMRVIAHGRLKQREYEDKKGIIRSVIELEVEEIGPSLKYATAEVKKAARSGPAGGQPPHPADSAPPRQDVGGWDQMPAGVGAGWSASDDEPPF